MPDQVRHDGFGTFYETIKDRLKTKRQSHFKLCLKIDQKQKGRAIFRLCLGKEVKMKVEFLTELNRVRFLVKSRLG